MKRNILCIAAGLAGLMLGATASQAQVTYNTTSGDFLLGFRYAGNTTSSVLVDIGTLTNPFAAQTFTLGNLGTVLSNTYGNGYATDPNLFFSLASTSGASSGAANYVTRSTATAWSSLTSSNNNILTNKLIAEGLQYNTYSAQQSVGNAAVVESGGANDYLKYVPGGTNDAGHANGNIAYGFFNPTTEANLTSGTAGTLLYLDQVGITGLSTTQVLGTFQLSSDFSSLTYTPTAVPEPSTYASLAVGAALLLLAQRRRSRALKA